MTAEYLISLETKPHQSYALHIVLDHCIVCLASLRLCFFQVCRSGHPPFLAASQQAEEDRRRNSSWPCASELTPVQKCRFPCSRSPVLSVTSKVGTLILHLVIKTSWNNEMPFKIWKKKKMILPVGSTSRLELQLSPARSPEKQNAATSKNLRLHFRMPPDVGVLLFRWSIGFGCCAAFCWFLSLGRWNDRQWRTEPPHELRGPCIAPTWRPTNRGMIGTFRWGHRTQQASKPSCQHSC